MRPGCLYVDNFCREMVMSFKMRALGLLANQFFAGSFDEYLLPLAVKTFSMLKMHISGGRNGGESSTGIFMLIIV